MKTNLEIIREFYETLNLELVDPDVNWNVADGLLVDGHYQGRKAMQEWTNKLAAQFGNWKHVPEQLLDLGDVIIASGHYQGGSQVTEKPFNVPFSHIWLMKDGRIIKLNQHINTLILHRAIAPDKVLKD